MGWKWLGVRSQHKVQGEKRKLLCTDSNHLVEDLLHARAQALPGAEPVRTGFSDQQEKGHTLLMPILPLAASWYDIVS